MGHARGSYALKMSAANVMEMYARSGARVPTSVRRLMLQHHIAQTGSARRTMPDRADVWDESYATDEGSCWVCRCALHRRDKSWERGHIVPRARGGTCELSNLTPMCRTCNQKIADTDAVTARARQATDGEKLTVTSSRTSSASD